MKNLQQLSAQAVHRVLEGRNLGTALESVTRAAGLSNSERATVQALSYGSLRHLGYARFALAQLAPRAPKNPLLSALLWVAIHQLETSSAEYAVVDSAVEAAASIDSPALKPFVNAVLRNYLRKREHIRAAALLNDEARYSYPQWWIRKLREQIGEHAADVLDAGNQHPPMWLRVNQRRIDVAAYHTMLAKHAIPACVIETGAIRLAKPHPVDDLPGFSAGLSSVQDAGAQHAAMLLDAGNGQRVLDACAAPGGKTAHLLEIADLDLTALDSDAQRLERVRQNLQRLGLTAQLHCADAAAPEHWWDGHPYDRILLDGPCSASGVVRRHPDIKWLRRPEDIDGFARQQKRLLDALWKVLARGGKLLYATCSIFAEENEDQVSNFLVRHADARHLNHPGTGLMLPNQEHDGFYYALVEKI